MKPGYLITVIILLIVVNLLLLYNSLQLQHRLREASDTNKGLQKINSIPEFQIQDLEGKIFSLASLRKKPILF